MGDDWLTRAQDEGTPVIDAEGQAATFVWHGSEAPQLIGDMTGWEGGSPPLDLTEVAPGVWIHTLALPPDAYIEYSFWDGQERIADPLNPRTSPDGMGHSNHYFYMPGAAPTPLTRRRRRAGRHGVPHGTVTRHVVEDRWMLAGGKRTVLLYRPPVDGPVPLLVVLDGQDYRRRGKIVNIVDNLIAEGRIRPVAMALPYHGGPARGIEYSCSETTLGFLHLHVLPLARKELDLVSVQAQPGAFGILGASMGGLMALYAGLRAPEVFGRVLSQSGAFAADEHEYVVWDLIRYGPVRPLRIWMDAGRFEWLLPPNRGMHDLLVEHGYDVTYREYNGGHNYPSWRDEVWRGLEHLFPARWELLQ